MGQCCGKRGQRDKEPKRWERLSTTGAGQEYKAAGAPVEGASEGGGEVDVTMGTEEPPELPSTLDPELSYRSRPNPTVRRPTTESIISGSGTTDSTCPLLIHAYAFHTQPLPGPEHKSRPPIRPSSSKHCDCLSPHSLQGHLTDLHLKY